MTTRKAPRTTLVYAVLISLAILCFVLPGSLFFHTHAPHAADATLISSLLDNLPNLFPLSTSVNNVNTWKLSYNSIFSGGFSALSSSSLSALPTLSNRDGLAEFTTFNVIPKNTQPDQVTDIGVDLVSTHQLINGNFLAIRLEGYTLISTSALAATVYMPTGGYLNILNIKYQLINGIYHCLIQLPCDIQPKKAHNILIRGFRSPPLSYFSHQWKDNKYISIGNWDYCKTKHNIIYIGQRLGYHRCTFLPILSHFKNLVILSHYSWSSHNSCKCKIPCYDPPPPVVSCKNDNQYNVDKCCAADSTFIAGRCCNTKFYSPQKCCDVNGVFEENRCCREHPNSEFYKPQRCCGCVFQEDRCCANNKDPWFNHNKCCYQSTNPSGTCCNSIDFNSNSLNMYDRSLRSICCEQSFEELSQPRQQYCCSANENCQCIASRNKKCCERSFLLAGASEKSLKYCCQEMSDEVFSQNKDVCCSTTSLTDLFGVEKCKDIVCQINHPKYDPKVCCKQVFDENKCCEKSTIGYVKNINNKATCCRRDFDVAQHQFKNHRDICCVDSNDPFEQQMQQYCQPRCQNNEFYDVAKCCGDSNTFIPTKCCEDEQFFNNNKNKCCDKNNNNYYDNKKCCANPWDPVYSPTRCGPRCPLLPDVDDEEHQGQSIYDLECCSSSNTFNPQQCCARASWDSLPSDLQAICCHLQGPLLPADRQAKCCAAKAPPNNQIGTDLYSPWCCSMTQFALQQECCSEKGKPVSVKDLDAMTTRPRDEKLYVVDVCCDDDVSTQYEGFDNAHTFDEDFCCDFRSMQLTIKHKDDLLACCEKNLNDIKKKFPNNPAEADQFWAESDFKALCCTESEEFFKHHITDQKCNNPCEDGKEYHEGHCVEWCEKESNWLSPLCCRINSPHYSVEKCCAKNWNQLPGDDYSEFDPIKCCIINTEVFPPTTAPNTPWYPQCCGYPAYFRKEQCEGCQCEDGSGICRASSRITIAKDTKTVNIVKNTAQEHNQHLASKNKLSALIKESVDGGLTDKDGNVLLKLKRGQEYQVMNQRDNVQQEQNDL